MTEKDQDQPIYIPFIPLDKEETHFEFQQPAGFLNGVANLKQINCFAGANNSGKSRLIRELYRVIQKYPDAPRFPPREIFSTHKKNNLKNLYALSLMHLGDKYQELSAYLQQLFDEEKGYLPSSNTFLQKAISSLRGEDIEKGVKDIDIKTFNNYIIRDLKNSYTSSYYLYQDLPTEVKKLQEKCDSILKNQFSLPNLYIPILRGIRKISGNTDSYAAKTKQDYKITRVFTGLSLFEDLMDHLLGTYEQRALIKEFEEFLSTSFFDEQPISLIPMRKTQVVNVRIGEEEHPIYDLGDGIQAIIVLTFPLFVRKNKEYAIFIEEPEAHLHPNWQRFFMDTIVEYFPRHQFFLTTHSSTILGHENANVYAVKNLIQEKKKITSIQHLDNDHTDLLQELGYSSSDLFQANYIIWVEGVSDKIYIKQFIKAYDPSLKEGIHYMIMFYGGCAQLGHLTMEAEDNSHRIKIAKINPNFAFIVDSDAKQAKGFSLDNNKEHFQRVCQETNKICWITEVREIENLIPLDIWKQAAINYAEEIKPILKGALEATAVQVEDENNPDYNDRTNTSKNKTKGTRIPYDKQPIKVNDKIKMAKQVAKLFPLQATDLNHKPELLNHIKAIAEEIKQANKN